MATGVAVHKSTDAGAPTLSGTAGDLITLLDYILVTNHGWSKPFSGTNTAVYRMAGGNQFYLDVNDNGPGAAGAQEARMRGYETMTAVATGTGPFPTVAQLAAGIILRKSAAASATTRPWVAVADDRTVYTFIQSGDSANVYLGFMFGDIYSYLVGDGYRSMIVGRVTENSATTAASVDLLAGLSSTRVAAISGHYIARSHSGFAGAVALTKWGDASASTNALVGTVTFPNPVDGGLYVSPVSVGETSGSTRGQLRGFWHQMHPVGSFADLDTFDSIDGRSYLLLKLAGSNGVYCLETSDTWDTSV